ncbi:hypothetical protein EUTSA_v10002749mg [Eutrema salsugineum]|uniref:Uncharacterized protein n=1 Tax=Eutrema salsugineum TaxID=72664 RepID=V4L5I1_EUTSA|nr:hypothetical protein EUTSA_v10002749mg [Eutrema salsugineum]
MVFTEIPQDLLSPYLILTAVVALLEVDNLLVYLLLMNPHYICVLYFRYGSRSYLPYMFVSPLPFDQASFPCLCFGHRESG